MPRAPGCGGTLRLLGSAIEQADIDAFGNDCDSLIPPLCVDRLGVDRLGLGRLGLDRLGLHRLGIHAEEIEHFGLVSSREHCQSFCTAGDLFDQSSSEPHVGLRVEADEGCFIELAARLQRVNDVVRVGRHTETYRNAEFARHSCAGEGAHVGHAEVKDVWWPGQSNRPPNTALDRRQVFPAVVRRRSWSGFITEGHHGIRQGDAARRQRSGDRVGHRSPTDREYVSNVVTCAQRLTERDEQTGNTASIALATQAQLTVETVRQHQLRNAQTVGEGPF